MSTHREHLTAPPSWWVAAVVFGAIWGWIALVVGGPTAGVVVAVAVAAAALAAVWRYGAVPLEAGPDGLRAGSARLERRHVGEAQVLGTAAYRERLGPGADARAWLVTRPYLDRGVLVPVDDPADPTPYWLVSSRHPEALARSLTPATTEHQDGGHLDGTQEEVD